MDSMEIIAAFYLEYGLYSKLNDEMKDLLVIKVKVCSAIFNQGLYVLCLSGERLQGHWSSGLALQGKRKLFIYSMKALHQHFTLEMSLSSLNDSVSL